MKSKLKVIIPIGIAVIAIALAFVFIRFTPSQKADIKAIISTAQQYITEQKFEQAIAEFKKAIEIDPRNVDAYIGIAQAYEAIGDTESALEWLHKGYDLTGDSSLKAEIDRISGLAEEVVTAAEGTAETATEPSSNAEKLLEKKIVYADNWYSILKYDENENIICMDLYTSSDQKRLSANYDYSGSSVKRTVYVDDDLCYESNVNFSDIMAEVEDEKKKRANTTERSDSNWWIYDENGNCVEHGRNDGDSEGNITNDAGGEEYYSNGIICKSHSYYPNYDLITYYDENGYAIKSTGIDHGTEINDIYTYDYDENGYPIVEYINGEKGAEYINFYKDNSLVYKIYQYKDGLNNHHGVVTNGYGYGIHEINDKKQYIRFIHHVYYHWLSEDDVRNEIGIAYYVLSYDESKVIDEIWMPQTELPLFGCPFCYEEN